MAEVVQFLDRDPDRPDRSGSFGRFAVAYTDHLLASSGRSGMARIRFGIAILAAVAPVFAAGCSHASPPPLPVVVPPPPCTTPEPLRVTLVATAQLNPGEKGEPLAAVVRLYQLKGTGKLQGAAFDDILDHDKDALGDELVAMNEVTISPGDRLEPPIVRNPESAYLAAVALFRRPAGSTWRAVKKLPPPDPQHCQSTRAPKRLLSPSPAAATRFVLDENRIDLR
jgi:type VI secretion system protein VasD